VKLGHAGDDVVWDLDRYARRKAAQDQGEGESVVDYGRWMECNRKREENAANRGPPAALARDPHGDELPLDSLRLVDAEVELRSMAVKLDSRPARPDAAESGARGLSRSGGAGRSPSRRRDMMMSGTIDAARARGHCT